MTVQGFELTYRLGGAEDSQAMEKFVAAFERAGEELRDFGKYLWPKLTPLLERRIGDQFDAEGGGAQGSWAPLSAQYAAWKEANYPGMPILRRTGAMYEGLTSDSPFSLRQSDGDSYRFGTQGVTYASYHQSGTGRMPARPVFDFIHGSFDTELSRIGVAAMRDAMQQARLDQVADLSGLHE